MLRIERSSVLLALIAAAASLALRSANSSRIRFDSKVGLPEINEGRPPGWIEVSSIRVRGVSTNWIRGEVPPTRANSSRHSCHTGSATLMFDSAELRLPAVGASKSTAGSASAESSGNGSSSREICSPMFEAVSSGSNDSSSDFRLRGHTSKTLCLGQ